MNLCSDDHEEVCYEGRDCPVCEVRKVKNETIEELKSRIESAESEISDLASENASLAEELDLKKNPPSEKEAGFDSLKT